MIVVRRKLKQVFTEYPHLWGNSKVKFTKGWWVATEK